MDDEMDSYFGLCPECHECDGFISIGRGHWFFCEKHHYRWFAGSNIFSVWRDETEEEQRERYEQMNFGSGALTIAFVNNSSNLALAFDNSGGAQTMETLSLEFDGLWISTS